ncbi:hypothetical protein KCG44_04940 [Pacificimonas sp. WHA3]|uniref:Adenylate-forming enzyme n=1 Tax=Pacificimonas pallii TaxID=2827236 RepID=A0ABS6SDZ1_9SPHN|nr:hypothetical protein [Pacificimonas pallii]MBV7256126.1 hypothetical protein [Pacificimonas pallii]
MSAERLAQHRARFWSQLQPWIALTPALASHYGEPLARFPIVEPSDLRADYGAWNSHGKSDAELRRLANAAEAGELAEKELSAGWSTGTSGDNRGLFLADSAERADYVGQSLARLLPAPALLKKQRLALHLRASNSLYSDVKGGRFAFKHIPLVHDIEDVAEQLQTFSPTILIAPPHRLLDLAKVGLHLPDLRYLFCGSEPISQCERDVIKQAFCMRPRSIYQATEGFLAADCEHGRLHLNEYAIEFELEPVPGTKGFRPIITDLRRKSQPIVRLRSDDFIELDERPCFCGFGGRAILPPQGRVSDLWHISGRVLTPRQIVEAVEAELGGAVPWQAIADSRKVTLQVAPDDETNLAERAGEALSKLVGLDPTVVQNLEKWTGPKRRKVMWADG